MYAQGQPKIRFWKKKLALSKWRFILGASRRAGVFGPRSNLNEVLDRRVLCFCRYDCGTLAVPTIHEMVQASSVM